MVALKAQSLRNHMQFFTVSLTFFICVSLRDTVVIDCVSDELNEGKPKVLSVHIMLYLVVCCVCTWPIGKQLVLTIRANEAAAVTEGILHSEVRHTSWWLQLEVFGLNQVAYVTEPVFNHVKLRGVPFSCTSLCFLFISSHSACAAWEKWKHEHQ